MQHTRQSCNDSKVKILGIAASLRNARCGRGSDLLVKQIGNIETREELNKFLRDQASICLEQFVSSGRNQGMPFDHIYQNYKTLKGDRGLSNSEVALAAALWGAKMQDVEIDHVGLSDFFKPNGHLVDKDILTRKLLSAHAILIAGPVYFGDRGSLAHDFIEFLRTSTECASWLQNALYAGIAVGAKRNGGQETTLIYQMLDMINLGFLGVGNDSETTSQYGGTGVAGDVGTMAEDEYGLNTSIGTGRRIGRVAKMLSARTSYLLEDKLRIGVWVLQDQHAKMIKFVGTLRDKMSSLADLQIMDFSSGDVARCIACDICPTHIDVDANYRCIIKHASDVLLRFHDDLIAMDGILVACYSPKVRRSLKSNYQKLIERTRYLRRGDYVLGDQLIAPLVLEELGSNENLHVRTMTSMIRHHTVLYKPMITYTHDNNLLNLSDTLKDLQTYIQSAKNLTIARLATATKEDLAKSYNPVGYILSAAKDKEEKNMARRKLMVEDRMKRLQGLADRRLGSA